MNSQDQPTCRFLDWDSQFFGIRVAQVTRPMLDRCDVNQALDWCINEKIDCLYCLVPVDDIRLIHILETFGFHLVDIRMTFELSTNLPTTNAMGPQIRIVKVGDIDALKEIASLTYQSTRFFNDGHFSKSLCKLLYSTWIEKSCSGYAQVVWVAETNNKVVGFITCQLVNTHGQIGLLGIHNEYHHQGWGRKLVGAAINWFAGQGCQTVRVVTQGNNLAAQKLYAACGFNIASMALWYHRWFDPMKKG